jgi:hypothetical protein
MTVLVLAWVMLFERKPIVISFWACGVARLSNA